MSKQDETIKITIALLELTCALINQIEYDLEKDEYSGTGSIEYEGYQITCDVKRVRG